MAPDLPHINAAVMRMWDRLPKRVQLSLIKRNARAVVKAARNAVQSFDHKRERARSKSARRIYKWRDYWGRKLPSSEDGITQHQLMISEYEARYSALSETERAGYARVYDAIRRQIGKVD